MATPHVSRPVIAYDLDWAFCIYSWHAEQHAINTLKDNGLAEMRVCVYAFGPQTLTLLTNKAVKEAARVRKLFAVQVEAARQWHVSPL